jgi:hypothetical protein
MFERLEGNNCNNCQYENKCIYTRPEDQEPAGLVGKLRRGFKEKTQSWCTSYWPNQNKQSSISSAIPASSGNKTDNKVNSGKSAWESIIK